MMEFDSVLTETERIGLDVIAYGIFGMPGQTIEEMIDTLIYLMSRRVLIGPSIYYPVPGTSLFERCKKEGSLPSHPSQFRSSAFPIETKQFCRLDLATLFRLARVLNFVKGKIDTNEIEEGITWGTLCRIMNVKAEARVGDDSSDGAEPPAPGEATWKDLLLMLVEEKSFFSLRKGSDRKVRMVREETSKRVLDCFLEKGSNAPILRSRSSRKIQ
jgi:hypothetical protein